VIFFRSPAKTLRQHFQIALRRRGGTEFPHCSLAQVTARREIFRSVTANSLPISPKLTRKESDLDQYGAVAACTRDPVKFRKLSKPQIKV
jgi:hypothetical protein